MSRVEGPLPAVVFDAELISSFSCDFGYHFFLSFWSLGHATTYSNIRVWAFTLVDSFLLFLRQHGKGPWLCRRFEQKSITFMTARAMESNVRGKRGLLQTKHGGTDRVPGEQYSLLLSPTGLTAISVLLTRGHGPLEASPNGSWHFFDGSAFKIAFTYLKVVRTDSKLVRWKSQAMRPRGSEIMWQNYDFLKCVRIVVYNFSTGGFSVVDVFMDAAFDSVRKDIGFFELELQTLNTKLLSKRTSLAAAETTAHTAAQQCEASLEALHSLCLQKAFRERLLQNKELCENGGVLCLALSVLKLQVPANFRDAKHVIASVSRSKSKILSMLLQLCESESYSYLDKVANSPRSMHLAVSVVSEVLDLLKVTLRREPKQHKGYSDRSNPKGHVLLNSMRLVDNLSNDTNFRSLIISNITGDLVRILALPPEEFLSSWCAVDLAESEEDATLVYDPFHAAGAVMVSLQSAGPCFVSTSATIAALPVETNGGCTLTMNCMPPSSHAQQRTASLVNILANLHCYVPGICKEVVKDQFINKFLDCLAMGDLTPASDNFCGSEAQTTVQICKNLCTLRDHAISLIPKLHKEDVRVLSSPFPSLLSRTSIIIFIPSNVNGSSPRFNHERLRSASSKEVDVPLFCVPQRASISSMINKLGPANKQEGGGAYQVKMIEQLNLEIPS
eukprot:Gb_38592 [translate_table: standard]